MVASETSGQFIEASEPIRKSEYDAVLNVIVRREIRFLPQESVLNSSRKFLRQLSAKQNVSAKALELFAVLARFLTILVKQTGGDSHFFQDCPVCRSTRVIQI